jgi:hypothetical protein
MIKKKGEFYWPIEMIKPYVRRRDSKETNKNIRLVDPEEIGEAALIVLKKEYSMPKDDLIDQTAKVLGFTRVTEDIDRYIWKSIDNYKKCNKILEINERFTFNTDEEEDTGHELETFGGKNGDVINRIDSEKITIKGKEDERNRLKHIEKIIKQAIENHYAITVEYISRSSGFTVRRIEPRYYDGIYIRAFCYLVKEDRTFRIDRIKKVVTD